MELHTILKNVDNLDGPILDIGFGKGKFSDLMLNYILSNTIRPRKFIAFDTFNKYEGNTHPRWAIDFKNNALNKANLETTIEFGLVDEHLESLVRTAKPAITFISLPELDLIKSALKKTFNKVDKGSIIIVDTKWGPKVEGQDTFDMFAIEKNSVISLIEKFCTDNSSNYIVASKQNYAYIVKGDMFKSKLASPISNKIKRERSVNLT